MYVYFYQAISKFLKSKRGERVRIGDFTFT